MKSMFKKCAVAVSLGMAMASLDAPVFAAEPIVRPPVDLAAILPPPPAQGSAAANADIQQVLAVQQQRTPEQVALAKDDAAHKSVSRFDAALASPVDVSMLPHVEHFFEEVAALDKQEVGGAKQYWHRPRPGVVSVAVRPIKKEKPDDWSYPSGHATYGYSLSALLSSMVPERRAALFARADQYGQSRIVMGAHFPSDVEGGKLAGTVIAAYVLADPQLHDDYVAARAELRGALHLSVYP